MRAMAYRGPYRHHPPRLLKIGAAIVGNTRRVRLFLASNHPLQHVFEGAARAPASP